MRMSAPLTLFTSVMESKGRLIAACVLRIASASGPDEAERLTILEIDVGGVTDHVELFAGLLQRVELIEELLFSQFFLGEAALGLVMGVNEVLHVVLLYTLVVVHIHYTAEHLSIGFLYVMSASYWGVIVGRASCRPNEVIQGTMDGTPSPIA
jgi:hypothetical protein